MTFSQPIRDFGPQAGDVSRILAAALKVFVSEGTVGAYDLRNCFAVGAAELFLGDVHEALTHALAHDSTRMRHGLVKLTSAVVLLAQEVESKCSERPGTLLGESPMNPSTKIEPIANDVVPFAEFNVSFHLRPLVGHTDFHSILRFTACVNGWQDQDAGVGCCVPAFFMLEKNLYVCTSTNRDGNRCTGPCRTDLQPDIIFRVAAVQRRKRLSVYINDVTVCHAEADDVGWYHVPADKENLTVMMGDTFYEPANAEVSNLAYRAATRAVGMGVLRAAGETVYNISVNQTGMEYVPLLILKFVDGVDAHEELNQWIGAWKQKTEDINAFDCGRALGKLLRKIASGETEDDEVLTKKKTDEDQSETKQETTQLKRLGEDKRQLQAAETKAPKAKGNIDSKSKESERADMSNPFGVMLGDLKSGAFKLPEGMVLKQLTRELKMLMESLERLNDADVLRHSRFDTLLLQKVKDMELITLLTVMSAWREWQGFEAIPLLPPAADEDPKQGGTSDDRQTEGGRRALNYLQGVRNVKIPAQGEDQTADDESESTVELNTSSAKESWEDVSADTCYGMQAFGWTPWSCREHDQAKKQPEMKHRYKKHEQINFESMLWDARNKLFEFPPGLTMKHAVEELEVLNKALQTPNSVEVANRRGFDYLIEHTLQQAKLQGLMALHLAWRNWRLGESSGPPAAHAEGTDEKGTGPPADPAEDTDEKGDVEG